LKNTTTMLGLGFAGGLLALTLAAAAPASTDAAPMFEVTVTNLTRGQIFSPLLVTSHTSDISLFVAGEPALPELGTLAEEGNNAPLAALLGGLAVIEDVQTGAGGILPGASDTVMIRATGKAPYISLASMLVNTNDAFVGLDAFQITRELDATVYAVAYDAGTEFNSESCDFIPGPACGSAGAHDPAPAEGYVYVSNGVQGVGDLATDLYDWRNPVAKITIRRMVNMP